MTTKVMANQICNTTQEINVNEVTKNLRTIFADVKAKQLSLSQVFKHLAEGAKRNATFAPVVGGSKSPERGRLRKCFLSNLPQVTLIDGTIMYVDFVEYKDFGEGKYHTMFQSARIPSEKYDKEFEGCTDKITRKVKRAVMQELTDKQGHTHLVPVKDNKKRIVKEEKDIDFSVREKTIWGYSEQVEYAFVTALLQIMG